MKGFNEMTQQELEALSDVCKCDEPCDAYGGCDKLPPAESIKCEALVKSFAYGDKPCLKDAVEEFEGKHYCASHATEVKRHRCEGRKHGSGRYASFNPGRCDRDGVEQIDGQWLCQYHRAAHNRVANRKVEQQQEQAQRATAYELATARQNQMRERTNFGKYSLAFARDFRGEAMLNTYQIHHEELEQLLNRIQELENKEG